MVTADGVLRRVTPEREPELFRGLGARVPGRALNFSFGGGDRTAGFHEPETAKRLAGLVSQYDPAGLFGGPCEG